MTSLSDVKRLLPTRKIDQMLRTKKKTFIKVLYKSKEHVQRHASVTAHNFKVNCLKGVGVVILPKCIWFLYSETLKRP